MTCTQVMARVTAAEPQPAFGVACGMQQTPPEPHAPSGIEEPPHDSFALMHEPDTDPKRHAALGEEKKSAVELRGWRWTTGEAEAPTPSLMTMRCTGREAAASCSAHAATTTSANSTVEERMLKDEHWMRAQQVGNGRRARSHGQVDHVVESREVAVHSNARIMLARCCSVLVACSPLFPPLSPSSARHAAAAWRVCTAITITMAALV